jgi:hypothetical protein
VERRNGLEVPFAGSGTCFDVGSASVCWPPGADQAPLIVERTLPPFRARSKMGFRCTMSGGERTCSDRRDDAADFQCQKDRCVQVHSRVPDAHEWTCSDAGGASLCLSKGRAAAVRATWLRAGFLCGNRQNLGTKSEERVCLDFSPDYPDDNPSGWNCHYEHDAGVTRICQRAPRPALGSVCDPTRPVCPAGAACSKGHCLPRKLELSCWLDGDCQSGKCRFGACVSE